MVSPLTPPLPRVTTTRAKRSVPGEGKPSAATTAAQRLMKTSRLGLIKSTRMQKKKLLSTKSRILKHLRAKTKNLRLIQVLAFTRAD